MKWNTVIFQWINIFWHPLLICPHWPSSPNDTQIKNGSVCNRPCCKWSWSQLIKDRLSCFPTRQLIITIRSLRDFETSSTANRFLMFLEDDSGGVLLHCQTSQIKNNVYNLGTTFNKMTVCVRTATEETWPWAALWCCCCWWRTSGCVNMTVTTAVLFTVGWQRFHLCICLSMWYTQGYLTETDGVRVCGLTVWRISPNVMYISYRLLATWRT